MTQETKEDTREPEHHEAFAEGEEAAPPGVRVMAVLRWLLVLGMGAIAAASLVHVYGRESHAESVHGVVYYCPMHPSVVQDHPGECPICSMSLVVREPAAQPAGTSETDSAGFDLSPERVQLIGMRTAAVVKGPLSDELRSVGYVTPTEQGVASVQTRFSGWIQELPVNTTGQPVTRGQLLARVYSPDLLSLQQELLNASRWSAAGSQPGLAGPDASQLLASARSRLSLMGVSDAEIADIEHTGQVHSLIDVRSPLRGFVSEKNAVQGVYVQPGVQLFQIADLSRVWVTAEVFERDAARVAVGQTATLELSAYPGEQFSGRVEFLSPMVDASTRTLRARLVFKNPDLRLRPGMYGDIRIALPAATGLFVPREAVVDTGERSYVFVTTRPGHFEPKNVQLGLRTDERVQVLAGLVEGEQVVTSGNFLLDSESKLREAVSGHAQHGAGM